MITDTNVIILSPIRALGIQSNKITCLPTRTQRNPLGTLFTEIWKQPPFSGTVSVNQSQPERGSFQWALCTCSHRCPGSHIPSDQWHHWTHDWPAAHTPSGQSNLRQFCGNIGWSSWSLRGSPDRSAVHTDVHKPDPALDLLEVGYNKYFIKCFQTHICYKTKGQDHPPKKTQVYKIRYNSLLNIQRYICPQLTLNPITLFL